MAATPAHCPLATLTLNPAVDVSYEIAQLLRDQKTHAQSVRYDPGGNGINIGRALKTLGASAHNFCVIAGEVGQLLQRLLKHQLDNLHIEQVAGETRINVVLQERHTAAQYQVCATGPALGAQHLENIAAKFIAASANGIGVLTGSVPPPLADSIYGELTQRIRAQGGRPVVDSYGALLRHAVAAKPFLIKPNRYELEELCAISLPTLAAVAEAARRLQRGGIEYVCVSLGAEGALLCGPDNTYFAAAPAVPVSSTVGAGDSMVAGLMFAFAHNDDAEHALRLAVACGTGTAQHPGTELFTGADIERLLPQISVRRCDV